MFFVVWPIIYISPPSLGNTIYEHADMMPVGENILVLSSGDTTLYEYEDILPAGDATLYEYEDILPAGDAGVAQSRIDTAMITPQKSWLPVRFSIPSLHINTSIESVGLTWDGAMQTPSGPDTVGWFALGSLPGEVGSAVIAGHYDFIGRKEAVFHKLDKLRPGDLILVENEKGGTLTFVVRKTQAFDVTADTTTVFSSAQGSHLNLITCNGVRDNVKKKYTKRLVVFTDLVE